MDIPFYQVDAFARRLFTGNPAAVCPLNQWLDDATLQNIAMENNLAETAFFVREAEGYRLRWFTPVVEMDLCGHATVASAWVLMNKVEHGLNEVMFQSRSGPLGVRREGSLYALDFPSRPPERIEKRHDLIEALGAEPDELWQSRDLMAVFSDEQHVRALAPDMTKIAALDSHAVIVTACGREADFVSRFFAPALGVPEDPVTGSAHCNLIPYWASVLGKTTLVAHQLSKRGGELFCELRGDRVKIAGEACLFVSGHIHLP